MWGLRDQQKERVHRIRGWILCLLCAGRPDPVSLGTLQRLLDQRNFPLSRRRLAEQVDHLMSLRLLRVFPSMATEDLDRVQQAKWIQRYANTDNDEELKDELYARITTAGVNFQDGTTDRIDGILRVE